MENLKQKLTLTDLNIKEVINWNNGDAIEETLLNLQELSV
jgi:hypothetical protein